jgi:hypothetical protein
VKSGKVIAYTGTIVKATMSVDMAAVSEQCIQYSFWYVMDEHQQH